MTDIEMVECLFALLYPYQVYIHPNRRDKFQSNMKEFLEIIRSIGKEETDQD